MTEPYKDHQDNPASLLKSNPYINNSCRRDTFVTKPLKEAKDEMPSPTLKITYFNGRGRAEPMRLACVLGDLDFIDDRFEFSQFAGVKTGTPYSAVPTMAIDGKAYAQSNSLLRYLGKGANLYPECPLAALQVDEIVDTLEDLLHCCFRYRGPDKEKLREDRRNLVEMDVPRYAGGVEKRLAAFGDGPYAVGDKLTIADLVIANKVNNFKSGFLDFVDTDAFNKYPRIMESYRAVMKEPKIVAWYQKHPIPNVSLPLTQ